LRARAAKKLAGAATVPGESVILAAMDLAIPSLPYRSRKETAEFYRRLGFKVIAHDDDEDTYLIATRGTIELHFFSHREVDPCESYAICYIRVQDADALHAEFSRLALPAAGIPRLTAIEDKPWGLREFAVVDPNGSLLRIGHVLRSWRAAAREA
jgi:catechol 2,3-dioxygenase-like lactoylglutathione lyase family enzyme